MRPRKTDSNQKAIVRLFRQLGFSVFLTHTIGHGFPDLVMGFRGRTYLIEVKTKKGKFTSDETTFGVLWKGHYEVVRDDTDVVNFYEKVKKENK